MYSRYRECVQIEPDDWENTEWKGCCCTITFQVLRLQTHKNTVKSLSRSARTTNNTSVKKHCGIFWWGFCTSGFNPSYCLLVLDEILMLRYPSISQCVIGTMYTVHFAHSVKSFSPSFHSSCVLKTKCYPIGLFTKRMHCPFSSRFEGSTSHACFKALVRQHSYLWNLISKWDENKARASEQFLTLHYRSRFRVLMPIELLLVFRVKAAVHWAACVWIVVVHVYIGSANRKRVKCLNNKKYMWTNTPIYWRF